MSGYEVKILDYLERGPRQAFEVAMGCGLHEYQVLRLLDQLEFEGHVTRPEGGNSWLLAKSRSSRRSE